MDATPEKTLLQAAAANLKAARDVELIAFALHEQCEKALSDAAVMVRNAQGVIADLLAACEAALRLLERTAEDTVGYPDTLAKEQIRAAVAKAKGGA
jgi:hypothetical protein